jgi:hypothetical protein
LKLGQALGAAKQIGLPLMQMAKAAIGGYRHAAHGISCHYMLLIRLLAGLCALAIELTIHFFAPILQSFCLDAVLLNIEQFNDSATRNCIKIPSICCRTVADCPHIRNFQSGVLFINHEVSVEDILKWADMAMYQAKEAG